MAFKAVSKKSNGDYPAKWEKVIGVPISGTVIEYKKDIMGKPGSNAVTIETEDGNVTVWIDKVLLDYEENYKPGTKIQFTWLGKKKSKRGFDFNDYKVEIDDGSDLPF